MRTPQDGRWTWHPIIPIEQIDSTNHLTISLIETRAPDFYLHLVDNNIIQQWNVDSVSRNVESVVTVYTSQCFTVHLKHKNFHRLFSFFRTPAWSKTTAQSF